MAVVLLSSLEAREQKDIEAAKAAFLKQLPLAAETARVHYVHELLKMHDKLMPLAHSAEWTDSVDARFQAINNEMKQHPAPANSDSNALAKLKVGKWQSPRHDYIYRSNGTWSMLPILDKDTTHGRWHIEGNQQSVF
jgi:hypothetical protein